MTAGYLQRLVARHTTGLAVRPRTVPRCAPVAVVRNVHELASIDTGAPVDPATAPSAADATTSPRAPHAEVREGVREPVAPPEPGERVARSHAERPLGRALERHMEIDASRALGVTNARSNYAIEPVARDVVELDAVVRSSTADRVDQSGRLEAPATGRRPASRGNGDRAEARDTPEAIHVHIGRIEVRAAPPPAGRQPATAPRVAGPEPLSLDAYLARTRP